MPNTHDHNVDAHRDGAADDLDLFVEDVGYDALVVEELPDVNLLATLACFGTAASASCPAASVSSAASASSAS
jgi:hypothetical protein